MESFDAVDSLYTPPTRDLSDAGEFLYLIDPITKLAVQPRYVPPNLPPPVSQQGESSYSYTRVHNRRNIDREYMRALLAEDQDNRCYYCCRLLIGVLAHIDHKEPLSKGGADSIENYCLACVKCNTMKAVHSVETFALRLLQFANY